MQVALMRFGQLTLNRRLTPLLALVLLLAATAPAAAAGESGTVPGSVTVEPSVACLLVEGTYDFGTHRFAAPDVPPQPHGSAAPATIRSCAGAGQDVLVQGTDATGEGEPAASWTLDPAAATSACQTDTYGITTMILGGQPLAISSLAAPLVSILPDTAVDVDAALSMPCAGSSGSGQTMTFSVVYTAVLGTGQPPDPNPSPAPKRTLTVLGEGLGAGFVTSVPAGLACPPVCAGSFDDRAVVTLAAVPQPGSGFVGWSGGVCSGAGTCTVTMTKDVVVTASFNMAPLSTLSVTRTGSGAGDVTSNPFGINCGSGCWASFATGTMVTLTASAGPGSTFAGWSGGGCTGTGTCVLVMVGSFNVAAAFQSDP